MRLTLRQLQIFCAVAQSGSTTAAAQALALSQSATSAALNELESALDARLFDRVGKHLQLNENGRALLPDARALLDAAEGIEAGFATQNAPQDDAARRAQLRLAASTTIGNYVLPPLLAAFGTRHPQVGLQMRIANTQEVIAAVAEFSADLGLIEGPCHDADMTVLPWLEDELVVVAAPSHPLAHAAASGKLKFAQLREARWLLRESGSGTREAVEQALLPHLHELRSDLGLGSSEAIKNAAAQGLGLSCLSRHVVADLLATGRLVVLPTTLPRLTRRLALVHHRKKWLSATLREFIADCLAAPG